MDLGDVPSWVAIAASALLGIAGLVVAGASNRRAKRANDHAKEANEIARKAVVRAEESNRIAEKANKFSENSNSLYRRQVAQQEENWFVQWEAKWDPKSSMLAFVNKGSDTAIKPTFVVTGDELHEFAKGVEDVPPGKEVFIALDEVAKKRDAKIEGDRRRASRPSNIIWVPGAFKYDAKAVIRWNSGLGNVAEQTIELTLR
jgi:hypothetical protein